MSGLAKNVLRLKSFQEATGLVREQQRWVLIRWISIPKLKKKTRLSAGGRERGGLRPYFILCFQKPPRMHLDVRDIGESWGPPSPPNPSPGLRVRRLSSGVIFCLLLLLLTPSKPRVLLLSTQYSCKDSPPQPPRTCLHIDKYLHN